MIEINDIQKDGDIYTIKYFAEGIEQELETPVLEEQLLAFIVDAGINIGTNIDGSERAYQPSYILEKNLWTVCSLYLSQPFVTSVYINKLRETELCNYLTNEVKSIRFLSKSEQDKSKYMTAAISKAKRLQLPKDFIESLNQHL